jgi:outer membrane protein assembly factor BamD (BamD/ComL family)
MIGEAREKLAAKQARVGSWYYGLKLYESSIIYFESLVQEFPETAVIPSVLFLLHDSYSQVGFRAEAEAARDQLLARYPDSEEARAFASEPTDDSGE